MTDTDLNVLGEGVDVVIHADDEALDDMLEVVAQMHAGPGSPRRCARRPSTWPAPRNWCSTTSASTSRARKTAPLAGNSIATDRGFIARDMPALDTYLHYRMIDVSSIKELCRRWYPRIYFGQPAKGLAHRALADIKESIRELQYYRRTAFVPHPGPSTSEIAEAVAELEGPRTAAAELDSASDPETG